MSRNMQLSAAQAHAVHKKIAASIDAASFISGLYDRFPALLDGLYI